MRFKYSAPTLLSGIYLNVWPVIVLDLIASPIIRKFLFVLMISNAASSSFAIKIASFTALSVPSSNRSRESGTM